MALGPEFLVLTAGRVSEVTKATGDERDSEYRLWAIAADRIKSERMHRVHISERVVKFLKSTTEY